MTMTINPRSRYPMLRFSRCLEPHRQGPAKLVGSTPLRPLAVFEHVPSHPPIQHLLRDCWLALALHFFVQLLKFPCLLFGAYVLPARQLIR